MTCSTLEWGKIDPRLRRTGVICVDRWFVQQSTAGAQSLACLMVETPSIGVVETPGCFHASGNPLGFPALAEE